MKRRLMLAGTIVAGLMAITSPAHAKFNVRVVIDGPGLGAPVELFNPGIDVGCVFSRPCNSASPTPAGPLGPRYEVSQWLEGHHARGRMMDRIAHDLYPYAPGGPWVFTPAGQTWHDWNRIRRVPSGWTQAPRSLMKTLMANGLRPKPPVERNTRAATPAEATQEGGLGTGGALVGVVMLLAGGAFLGRPRRRHRSSAA